MTIEELAVQSYDRDYSYKTKRNYDNIKQMRNEVLKKGFLCKTECKNAKKIAAINGVDYIDGTVFNNLNQVWLFFERSTKDVIWILKIDNMSKRDIEKIKSVTVKSLKHVILVCDNEDLTDVNKLRQELQKTIHVDMVDTLEQAVDLTKYTVTSGSSVIFTLFGNIDEENGNKSVSLFADKVFSL